MKLFKLPLLAQIEVFKNLAPFEYFLFTFCSKRFINAMKAVKYRNSRLLVEPCRGTSTVYDTIHWFFSVKNDNGVFKMMCLTTTSEYFYKSKYDTEWELGNRTLTVDSNSKQVRVYCPEKDVTVTRDVQKYLCDLFSLPPKIIFEGEYQFYDYLIPDSIHTSIISHHPSDNSMEQFYNFHSNQTLSINQSDSNNHVNAHNEHSIYGVENLLFLKGHVNIIWYILHFQGKNALFEKAFMMDAFIDGFLIQWKANNNDNLETFIAYQDPSALPVNVQNTIARLEKWDTEKHGSVYPYNSIISDHYTFPEGTFDCEGGYFIERNTDGRVATLKLTPQYFMFFVWK